MNDLDASNNVVWHLYMNATDMTDGLGHFIPVNNIIVNSTCGGGTGFSDLRSLSSNLQIICQDTPYNDNANVSFFLDVPPGQYNNTYFGDIWFYVNGTSVQVDPKNRTWVGPNNTTVLIERFIDIAWGGVPIDFATVAAGRSANATDNEHGWPSNNSPAHPGQTYLIAF